MPRDDSDDVTPAVRLSHLVSLLAVFFKGVPFKSSGLYGKAGIL